MGESVRFHDGLGRPVRNEPWAAQGVSTYAAAADAALRGRWDAAIELGRYAVQEASEGYSLYPVFVERGRSFLLQEGVELATLEADETKILAVLRLPDGSEFDLDRMWDRFTSCIDRFVRSCERRQPARALDFLERAREAWRQGHDRACDWVYGLLDVCARRLGEARVGDMWDALLEPLAESRDRYAIDQTPWRNSVEILLLDALESLRGHLSGPGRMGDVEVVEEPDRWVLRFDPCGSGGRTYRNDPDEGLPPRMEPPFNYAVTTGRHPWAWNEVGVCLYCAHCCELQQRIPIRRLGYPVRVVEPPTWPAAREGTKCSWSIYKDPSLVPREAYERVGEGNANRRSST